MKFVIEHDSLKNALSRALKGVEASSTLPLLSGILITATENKVVLENTNMDVSLRQSLIANIEEPGQAVVTARLLGDIVGHLPDQAISIQTKDNVLTLSSGKSLYHLNTFAARDYPAFPEYSLDQTVELPSSLLNTMVNRVAVASSTDKNRAILNGILLEVTANRLKLVTTDSVRLAVAEADIVSEVKDFQVIVPSRSLRNVLTLAAEEKTVTIGSNQSQVVFMFGEAVYISRRIEGVYPSYNKLIPTSHRCMVNMPVNEMYEAMQRVKAMTINNSEVTFQISAASNSMVITSRIPDQGNAREEVSVQVDGEDLAISFNSRFIYDCLQKTDNDVRITFKANDATHPGVFETDEGFHFLYLVMPVRPSF